LFHRVKETGVTDPALMSPSDLSGGSICNRSPRLVELQGSPPCHDKAANAKKTIESADQQKIPNPTGRRGMVYS
jgi:hypothetical protein